jgi:hypothetical protein
MPPSRQVGRSQLKKGQFWDGAQASRSALRVSLLTVFDFPATLMFWVFVRHGCLSIAGRALSFSVS